MNTLKIEKKLADKYKYKPLPEDLSQKYRQFYLENIPSWLNVSGSDNQSLYTLNGSLITNGYKRIVIGDYGAFIEFESEPRHGYFKIERGQEFRVFDERFKDKVKYDWLTIEDESYIKIYHQKRTVTYADYLPNYYYVSVHEVAPNPNIAKE